MKKFLLLLCLLMTQASWGSDLVIKYGVNVYKPGEPLGSTKAIFVSRQSRLGQSPFVTQLEAGGWFDNSGMAGRKSSALFSASIGIDVNAGVFFGQALVGPALITHPDSQLGGPFQFNNDFALGIQDSKTGARLGLNYKHDSSAGLEQPNQGRDLYLFRVSFPIPWWKP